MYAIVLLIQQSIENLILQAHYIIIIQSTKIIAWSMPHDQPYGFTFSPRKGFQKLHSYQTLNTVTSRKYLKYMNYMYLSSYTV